jgi:hypothetical protein
MTLLTSGKNRKLRTLQHGTAHALLTQVNAKQRTSVATVTPCANWSTRDLQQQRLAAW